MPFHTSHTFQPLNVFYFKPFKITFRKERYLAMAICKFSKLETITFNKWVDKALNQSLTKQNIKGVKAHYWGPL